MAMSSWNCTTRAPKRSARWLGSVGAHQQVAGDRTAELPGGTVIPAGGFYVVGGDGVDEAPGDDEDNDISLGNSSKNSDGVRLVDCTGEVQDTVLYGDAGEPIEDFELKDDLDGVSMAGMPREGLSVGRAEDGVDTNISEDDFAANTPPTPGEPNGAAGTGGGSRVLAAVAAARASWRR